MCKELVDLVDLDVELAVIYVEVEVANEDDDGGGLGKTPKLSALIISAALYNVR